ncbi:MAG: outer membrane beta-barrel protein [Gallionella sp.]
MKKSNLLNSLILAALAVPSVAMAADAPTDPASRPHMVMPAKSATPTFGDMLDASGVSINGYLDVAYSYLSGTGAFTSGTANRVFDTEPNSFNLHQAAITLAKQPKEGFGGLVNLTLGKDAGAIKSYGQTSNDFDVTQAFVQNSVGSVTVIAGKFVTASGAEVINSTANANYSRSILFGYAIPFTHTGLRATYAANDQLSLIAGLNNGWDQAKDANKQKTLELGVSYMPVKTFMLTVIDYSGREQFASNVDPVGGQRNLLDIVATLNATDQLTFVLNYDNGTQENDSTLIKAKWSGVAGYANYKMNDQWLVSLRAESLDDKDGYRTGVVQKWKEATLTLGYMPTQSVQLRAEVRADSSDQLSFIGSDGLAKKSQNSMGLEAIYKF